MINSNAKMLIEAKNISKVYKDSGKAIEVLRGIDITIEKGGLVGIYGASGSGKSTLLHILGMLDRPTSGVVRIDGVDFMGQSDVKMARIRNRDIGFVFQFYHLLPEFSALENVMLPALVARINRHDAEVMAEKALVAMGLAERLEHRPSQLSGGEQQRVALARAAVLGPKVILADEPTGNLDRETGEIIWDYLMALNRDKGIALVIVTHNPELIGRLSCSHELKDGQLSVGRLKGDQ